jgi:hypothetical protein
MKMEFWSTSFAAPKPSNMNLLAELVGNYPPMPLVTQEKTIRSISPQPIRLRPGLLSRDSHPRAPRGLGAAPPPRVWPPAISAVFPVRRPPSSLGPPAAVLTCWPPAAVLTCWPPSSLWPAAPHPRPATLGRVDPTRRSPPTCCRSSSTSGLAAIHLRQPPSTSAPASRPLQAARFTRST